MAQPRPDRTGAQPPAPTDRSRRGVVVAVDGPSGSGKSTVSRLVARQLGLAYLDTGAMYRAVCWWCLERGVPLDAGAAAGPGAAGPSPVALAARELDLDLGTDPAAPTVRVAGTDVTTAVRESRISTAVSAVATDLGVRAELLRRQRRVVEDAARGRGVVLEGRDTTTVVAPDADVRVLLVADEQARLARRARELHGEAGAQALARTRDEVLRRDADDATVSSFHTAADGVHTLDSSALTLEETVAQLLALVRAATGQRSA